LFLDGLVNTAALSSVAFFFRTLHYLIYIILCIPIYII
jgi:hypothetical protein